jgi:hypothetical protein
VRWRRLPVEDGGARLLRVGCLCGGGGAAVRRSAARPPVGGAAPWWRGTVPGTAPWWRDGRRPGRARLWRHGGGCLLRQWLVEGRCACRRRSRGRGCSSRDGSDDGATSLV